jgi:thiamine biosynthesis protein ThiS
MKLRINGKEEITSISTILALIEEKELNKEAIVIEHNQNILPKEKWEETKIKENDNIEIVSFVGGG